MLRLHGLVGHRDQPGLAGRLHALADRGVLEYVHIGADDVGRRRLRLLTDRGTDCAISLGTDETLTDGAVLLLEPGRAILARIGAARSLRLRPANTAAALRLGWHAGNLHWRVRFAGDDLVVLLDGAEADYVARIAALLDQGEVTVLRDDDTRAQRDDD